MYVEEAGRKIKWKKKKIDFFSLTVSCLHVNGTSEWLCLFDHYGVILIKFGVYFEQS